MSAARSDNVSDSAFERRDWSAAHAELQSQDELGDLSAEELERFALVARLLGRDREGDELLERAHHAFLANRDHADATRCAFWLAFGFMERGEMAHASGWLARGERILEEEGIDCAERGYLRIPEALQQLDGGDAESALRLCEEIAAIGVRFDDLDLVSMGRLGRGQALIRIGDTAEGATQLDEVMVAAMAGEVSPIVTGIIYCAVIEACGEIFDLRRAQEWTAALSDWCESQRDLVPFRGRCQVYRAEIMQFRGDWDAAVAEAGHAHTRLSAPPGHPAVGAAYYRQAELHRLRGALASADEAFRRAEEWGRQLQPGLALLRLAQGRTAAAATAIRHALDEARYEADQAGLLAAAVEIFLAADELPAARQAARDLAEVANNFGSAQLAAASQQSLGAVALAEGHATEALPLLRRALDAWQDLGAPYEAARARVLLARAASNSGDAEGAEYQIGAARDAFVQLGAAPDLRRLGGEQPSEAHGLTPRERQVLRLVATGMTNRAIAVNLTISDRTVANHVANILGKLGLTSRAAATAYAYEHGLV